MNLRLHNTLTRQVEEFHPLNPARVTLYLCGPTVYSYVHIGNARGPVVFGLLARLLRRRYGSAHVVYARNITDVDDKINAAAADAGVSIDTITQRFAAAYRDDIAAIGAELPDVIPYATAHIGEIIAMCERLIGSNHAYTAEGHVLFDVASYPQYGRLSGRSLDEMIAGARVEVAPYKKNPADFVLWKPSTDDLPGWPSPWGRGRPGWHIECSAMSAAHLGETLDIHAGGNDLLFPHHENEVAQSTCAHGGRIFSRYWVHNGMLTFDGRKMSKSLGNVMLLHELLKQHPGEVLRFMLLKAHYRQPLDFSAGALDQVRRTLDTLYGTLRGLGDIQVVGDDTQLPLEFEASLCDDLNTPEALALISQYAENARKATSIQEQTSAKRILLSSGAFLGLLQQDPEQWFHHSQSELQVDAAWIEQLLIERTNARMRKDYAGADRIRNQLADKGVVIEDGPQGARWKMESTATESK